MRILHVIRSRLKKVRITFKWPYLAWFLTCTSQGSSLNFWVLTFSGVLVSRASCCFRDASCISAVWWQRTHISKMSWDKCSFNCGGKRLQEKKEWLNNWLVTDIQKLIKVHIKSNTGNEIRFKGLLVDFRRRRMASHEKSGCNKATLVQHTFCIHEEQCSFECSSLLFHTPHKCSPSVWGSIAYLHWVFQLAQRAAAPSLETLKLELHG